MEKYAQVNGNNSAVVGSLVVDILLNIQGSCFVGFINSCSFYPGPVVFTNPNFDFPSCD